MYTDKKIIFLSIVVTIIITSLYQGTQTNGKGTQRNVTGTKLYKKQRRKRTD